MSVELLKFERRAPSPTERLQREVSGLVDTFRKIEELGRKTGNPNLGIELALNLFAVIQEAQKAGAAAVGRRHKP